jgi:NAD(P)H-dependent flavin oxidoreductase YrpB (nitropropane dioxygenase family)
VRTPICERLGIEFPIFAFSHCRDVVAAVSKAGGFGVLGALAYSPDELEVELDWIDEHVGDKPYGVDIVMPAKYVGKGGGGDASVDHLAEMIPHEHRQFVDRILAEHGVPEIPADVDTPTLKAAGLNVDLEGPGQVEVSLAHPKVKMLVNALGPVPPDVVAKAHEHGLLVGALVGARQHAERQVAIGVDVIVAQGTEAGGHVGQMGTLPLVRMVVRAVAPVPVLAAGGVADGAGLAGALGLGADGVLLGTRFLATPEAPIPQSHKQAILDHDGHDTFLSEIPDLVTGRVWPGAMTRTTRNRLMERWIGREWEVRQHRTAIQKGMADARAQGDTEEFHLAMGQTAGLIDDIAPAAGIVERIAREAEDIIRARLTSFLADDPAPAAS